MTITAELDEALHRVVMLYGDSDPASAATREIVRMVAERPELKGWDWVHDLRPTMGDGGIEDSNRVAEAFRGAPGGVCYTIFVTRDRHFGLWTSAMDHQFNGRKHLTAITVEQALADLDQLRGRL